MSLARLLPTFCDQSSETTTILNNRVAVQGLPDIMTAKATQSFKDWETDLPTPEVWQRHGILDGPGPPPGSKTDLLSWGLLGACTAGITRTRSFQDDDQQSDVPDTDVTAPCCFSGLVSTSGMDMQQSARVLALHCWISVHRVLHLLRETSSLEKPKRMNACVSLRSL